MSGVASISSQGNHRPRGAWQPIVVALAAALLGAAGCAHVVDCANICSKYQGCFKADYDVPACTSTCQSKTKESTNFSRKVESCDACISGKSCGGATFSCAPQCLGVVP